MTDPVTDVVLVHGGFVDGSGWRSVYDRLTAVGHRVSVVQNPTASLHGDVVATRRVLTAQARRAVLVGHSYGGVVITEAGNHRNVAALVYIAAFVPDKGESAHTLLSDRLPGASAPPIVAAGEDHLMPDRDGFHDAFARDLPSSVAGFMADSQVPWGVDAYVGAVAEPAWRIKPSWYLVATEDQLIPALSQRAMAERAGCTTVEVAASHAVHMSCPDIVATLVARAAAGAR